MGQGQPLSVWGVSSFANGYECLSDQVHCDCSMREIILFVCIGRSCCKDAGEPSASTEKKWKNKAHLYRLTKILLLASFSLYA